ncbi:inactive serine protease 54 [Leptodactylus fuscus]
MSLHIVMCCTFLIAYVPFSSPSCGVSEGFMADAIHTWLFRVSSFPWLVSVQDYNKSHLAVGTIISEFWIVTAPSALKLRKDLSVLVGITKEGSMDLHSKASYVIHKAIVHEEYDEILHSNDIMLLMTRDRIRFGYRVQPICFPSLESHNYALINCTVFGQMGQKDAGHMGCISWCRLSVENMNPCPLQRTVSTECCIHRKHHDPGCVETGGTPVLCQVKRKRPWLLVGVLSGAGMSAYVPVLYTRTSYYSDWISSRTTEAGLPFISSVTIDTMGLPPDSLRFRSAAKGLQPHIVEDESLMYDYYNENNISNAGESSSSYDLCLIIFVIFLVN